MGKIILFMITLTVLNCRAEDWTVNGKTLHNVVIGTIHPDRVEISFDGGVGTPMFKDLAPEVMKAHPEFKPDLAGAQAEAANKAAAVQQYAAQLAQSARKTEEDEKAKNIVHISGKILQKLPEGYRVRVYGPVQLESGAVVDFSSQEYVDSLPYTRDGIPRLRDCTIILISPKDWVDDDSIEVNAFLSGEASYTTVLGSQSTVRTYQEVADKQAVTAAR